MKIHGNIEGVYVDLGEKPIMAGWEFKVYRPAIDRELRWNPSVRGITAASGNHNFSSWIATPAEKPKEKEVETKCVWTDDCSQDGWVTGCGNRATPSENKHKFCPYCRRELWVNVEEPKARKIRRCPITERNGFLVYEESRQMWLIVASAMSDKNLIGFLRDDGVVVKDPKLFWHVKGKCYLCKPRDIEGLESGEAITKHPGAAVLGGLNMGVEEYMNRGVCDETMKTEANKYWEARERVNKLHELRQERCGNCDLSG